MIAPELKPCPVCHGPAQYRDTIHRGHEDVGLYACSSLLEKCMLSYQGGFRATAESWNRRAETPIERAAIAVERRFGAFHADGDAYDQLLEAVAVLRRAIRDAVGKGSDHA
jgi:hypothetical protein